MNGEMLMLLHNVAQLFPHERANPPHPWTSLCNVVLSFCPLSAGVGWSCPKPNLVSPPHPARQDRPSLYLDTTQPIKVLPLHTGFMWTSCAEI